MEILDGGRKVLFLYPPHSFSKSVIKPLFLQGYEAYKIGSTEKLLSLLQRFPDVLLFINTDYPYSKEFDLPVFLSSLTEELFPALRVYALFQESLHIASPFRDFIDMGASPDEQLERILKILVTEKAKGRREFIRYGSKDTILCPVRFFCQKVSYQGYMHDIGPKSLSFSSDQDLTSLVDKPFEDMTMTVGAYTIALDGKITAARTEEQKVIYVGDFHLEKDQEKDVKNFIFTSLEKSMDDFIRTL